MSGRTLLAAISDTETITGLLLAGMGHADSTSTNFLSVTSKTDISEIEAFMNGLLKRNDIAIILISQSIANSIRLIIDQHHAAFPSILEISTKDSPYDPAQDSVMKRINKLFGE